MIERTETNRGFYRYGETKCAYGSRCLVYESSSAEGPHVWLTVEQDPAILDPARSEVGKSSAHLNESQARELVARIQAWLDDIPERWT